MKGKALHNECALHGSFRTWSVFVRNYSVITTILFSLCYSFSRYYE